MLHQFVFCTMLLHILDSYGAIYTTLNATDKFTQFKEKYNKEYNDSKAENSHYLAFVNNLNAAIALNATSPDSKIIYVMNKYADLDPAEIEDRYGFHLKTYDAVKEGDHQNLLRSDHGVEINDNNLYNLRNSDELFENYIKEENRNLTGKREGFLHFYKFVKTLAEKNRAIYEGTDSPDLGHRADILRESTRLGFLDTSQEKYINDAKRNSICAVEVGLNECFPGEIRVAIVQESRLHVTSLTINCITFDTGL